MQIDGERERGLSADIATGGGGARGSPWDNNNAVG